MYAVYSRWFETTSDLSTSSVDGWISISSSWVPGDDRDLHPSWSGVLAFIVPGWVRNKSVFVGGKSLILPGWVGNISGEIHSTCSQKAEM